MWSLSLSIAGVAWGCALLDSWQVSSSLCWQVGSAPGFQLNLFLQLAYFCYLVHFIAAVFLTESQQQLKSKSGAKFVAEYVAHTHIQKKKKTDTKSQKGEMLRCFWYSCRGLQSQRGGTQEEPDRSRSLLEPTSYMYKKDNEGETERDPKPGNSNSSSLKIIWTYLQSTISTPSLGKDPWGSAPLLVQFKQTQPSLRREFVFFPIHSLPSRQSTGPWLEWQVASPIAIGFGCTALMSDVLQEPFPFCKPFWGSSSFIWNTVSPFLVLCAALRSLQSEGKANGGLSSVSSSFLPSRTLGSSGGGVTPWPQNSQRTLPRGTVFRTEPLA